MGAGGSGSGPVIGGAGGGGDGPVVGPVVGGGGSVIGPVGPDGPLGPLGPLGPVARVSGSDGRELPHPTASPANTPNSSAIESMRTCSSLLLGEVSLRGAVLRVAG